MRSTLLLPAALILLSTFPRESSGKGLYLDLPRWFSHPDTSRTSLTVSQAAVKGEHYDTALLTIGLGMRTGERTRLRFGILYPVTRREGIFTHGLADLLVSAEARLAGDSTGASGLYLRTDLRIPTGSGDLFPYAWESLDGGAGLEARGSLGPFRAAGSTSYILAGRRESSGDGSHENFLLAAACARAGGHGAIGAELFAAGQFFRGGGYREVYMLTLSGRISARTELRLSGALDSGGEKDRVFNSMLSVSVTIRFAGSSEEGLGPGPEPGSGPPSAGS